MTFDQRDAHATVQARQFVTEKVAVRCADVDEGWWTVHLEAARPGEPRMTWTVTGRGPTEVAARREADNTMFERARRYYADPADGLRQLEADRDSLVYVPGTADAIHHVRKALAHRGVAEHAIPGALAIGAAYARIAGDGTTVGALADELMRRPGGMPSGNPARLIA